MKDRLGEEFAGTISGVTGFGIFVTLDEVFVEGLVHISELGQDYFHFDQQRHQIVGERTKKKFQLADRVNIKVARVDIETSKIDFMLVGDRLKKAEPVPADPVAKSPWSGGGKPAAAPVLEKTAARAGTEPGTKPKPGKSGIRPSVPPLTVEPPRPARTEKKVVTFDSSNPPTTPMEGLAGGATTQPAPKLKVKTASPLPVAEKGRKMGALLTRKKK